MAETFCSEDRISAILDRLRRAQAIGELAVNTPTGIYPIKDINKDNIRRIFDFKSLDKKHPDADLTKENEAAGKGADFKRSSVSSSSKTLQNTKKEQLRKSTKEAGEIATAVASGFDATTDVNKISDGIKSHNVSISTTESTSISNSSSERSISKESEMKLPPSVASNVTIIGNELEETTNNATDQAFTTSLPTSNDIHIVY
ncbi:hypothetical protein KIN20_031010 [Parelaphostrongylus tenuis]|uniref:Uncharacterized protein n=1 Tax=Parelaphostrongylus tenuis TaxID=148309 RepID=A0AAD5R4Q1_PARTN|nr:hypothetical protein KIN20_031010 [Parelaphostrongylus tenuis]